MAGINGTWKLVSSDGLQNYLTAIGVSDAFKERGKNLEATGPNAPREEFAMDGSTLTRRVLKPDGSVVSEDKGSLGSETDGKSLDGRDIRVTMSVSGNKILRDETGDGYTAHWERVIEGDSMTLTMTSGGATCVRKFQRV